MEYVSYGRKELKVNEGLTLQGLTLSDPSQMETCTGGNLRENVHSILTCNHPALETTENVLSVGTCRVTVRRVSESRTRLSDHQFHFFTCIYCRFNLIRYSLEVTAHSSAFWFCFISKFCKTY